MKIHPLAGEVAPKSMLANIPRLVSAYYTHQPDVSDPTQQVAFGTSGHRGSSLKNSFNQDHILAISQALCEYRTSQHINGPLFMGMDTHALSEPALASALRGLCRCRCDRHDPQRAGLYAHTGHFACHLDLQSKQTARPGRRCGHHPFAQSA